MPFRFLTAGESHGRVLIGIIEGIPANLPLSSSDIDKELERRQKGYGRGGRMKIESDHAEILSGVRWGKTIGSPITLMIENRDFKNWAEGMAVDKIYEGSIPPLTRPRPGHADLAGVLKFNQKDIRNILERSSARETAMRVALGAVAKRFLKEFNIRIGSFVTGVGREVIDIKGTSFSEEELISFFEKAESSMVRCPDPDATERMVALIEEAIRKGNSLGGIFEVFAIGLPPGLGSHIQWDRRLDGNLARAIMSIQAIKGIEIGSGFDMAASFGSEVMDEIFYKEKRFFRKKNNAGGVEGGISNGMPLIVRAAMKPIPTLKRPLRTVEITSKEEVEAAYERSDVCAVPAASIVGEAMVALVITEALLDKFGGDSLEETKINFYSYLEYLRNF